MNVPPVSALRDTATEIVRRLQQAGFQAFWVGGCVRDFLLGREPDDYDIATSALPQQVERSFDRTIPVGQKFGVMIVVEGGARFRWRLFGPKPIIKMARVRSKSASAMRWPTRGGATSRSTACFSIRWGTSCTIGWGAKRTCGPKPSAPSA